MWAAHSVCCKVFERSAVASFPWGVPRLAEAYPQRAYRQLAQSARPSGCLRAEAAEDREGVAGDGLPDDLAAGLDLAVDASGERVGVLLRRRARDQVSPAPLDRVPLLFERVGQL